MNFIQSFLMKRKIQSFYKRTLFMYEILSDDLFVDILLHGADFAYSTRDHEWHDELFGIQLSQILLDTRDKNPKDCLKIFLMLNNSLQPLENEFKLNSGRVDEAVIMYDYIKICGIRFLMTTLANRFEKIQKNERLLLDNKLGKCCDTLIKNRVNNYIEQKTLITKITGVEQIYLTPEFYFNQVSHWVIKGKLNLEY